MTTPPDPAPPIQLAHVVLRTSQFTEMVTWWKNLLVAETRHQNDFISFLTYDEEHHRIAILNLPNLDDKARASAGLEHVAFTYADLDTLLATYERLKEADVTPVGTVHHGMTLSMYYADPDGNQVELQIDTMSLDDAKEFMASEVFAANPVGVAFDPDDLVSRRKAGETVEALTAYVPT